METGVMNRSELAKTLIKLLVCVAIGALFFVVPAPEGLEVKGWNLFGIFLATIVALIIKPFSMGTSCILCLTITMVIGILPLKDALAGFSNGSIWLIAIAFFISRGIIKTNLGKRIAFLCIRAFGKRTLGLSYAIEASDLILAPAMPSATARAGGILAPVVKSLSLVYGSDPKLGTEKKMGAFLHICLSNSDAVVCGMFLTAMAGNPMIAQIIYDNYGIQIDWGLWALAALVPGLISLFVMPLIQYKLCPPEIKKTPEARSFAVEELKNLGPVSFKEWCMMGVFVLILVLWIAGSKIGIDATVTGFIGLSVLLLTGVLDFDDIKGEKGAWDTFIWFAVLVMMAGQLNTLGFIPWFSALAAGGVGALPWIAAFIILVLVYFFGHYFFASATAHISAMYAAFVGVAIAAGAPFMLAALAFAYFSNLNCALTHYAGGPAPVLFGQGYLSQGKWWSTNFVVGATNLVIWLVIGGAWWKVLGLW